MPPKKEGCFRFTQRLAKFLDSLTDAQVEAVGAGHAELKVVEKGPRAQGGRGKVQQPDEKELRAILEYLHGAPDRDAGFARLERELKTKSALEALARLADLPVLKSDKVEHLRQRLVEATIGYRLRSEAVKGTGTKEDRKT